MKRKCLLTLDYELFFKESGTPDKSILEPTYALLKTLDRFGGKATFFVDALYLLKLQEIGLSSVYDDIEKQLIYLLSANHRIELHLHPHWADAQWIDGAWVFPTYRHYKLNSFSLPEINELFDKSVALLNKIGRKVHSDYSVVAFRAGGWCVEPFNLLKNSFNKHNIKIDSSVVPGVIFDGDIHGLDYSDITPASYYYFDDDIRMERDKGKFMEIPMSCYQTSFIERAITYIDRKINKEKAQIFGNGYGIPIVHKQSLLQKIFSAIKSFKKTIPFYIDGYNNTAIFCKKAKLHYFDILTIVGHPKTFTLNSLENIMGLSIQGFEFITISEFYCETHTNSYGKN